MGTLERGREKGERLREKENGITMREKEKGKRIRERDMREGGGCICVLVCVSDRESEERGGGVRERVLTLNFHSRSNIIENFKGLVHC